MSFKIYTKTGDQGQTSLIGGTRVPKHHLRIEAYGTVDEVNSWLGVLRENTSDAHHKAILTEIQHQLFIIGSLLAKDPDHDKMKLPTLSAHAIEVLENEIDRMDTHLPPLKNFVLPGGNQAAAFAHLARCTCRRGERSVTALHEQSPVPSSILIYLNRLSDYLFTLAREFCFQENSPEIPWIAPV